MNKQLLKDSLIWGVFLWLVGYILGIVLFMLVPASLIGWVITPIGIIITLWVLFKKTKGTTFNYYFILAIIWTLIAIAFDYLFIVKAFKSSNYYKPDVYLYYALTFFLSLFAGWKKNKKEEQ
jgi:hypothetical protein